MTTLLAQTTEVRNTLNIGEANTITPFFICNSLCCSRRRVPEQQDHAGMQPLRLAPRAVQRIPDSAPAVTFPAKGPHVAQRHGTQFLAGRAGHIRRRRIARPVAPECLHVGIVTFPDEAGNVNIRPGKIGRGIRDQADRARGTVVRPRQGVLPIGGPAGRSAPPARAWAGTRPDAGASGHRGDGACTAMPAGWRRSCRGRSEFSAHRASLWQPDAADRGRAARRAPPRTSHR